MATIPSQRVRTQRRIIEEVEASSFPIIRYDPEGRPLDADDQITARPRTALTNEIESSFIEAENYGRGEADDRDGWAYELILYFDSEVLFELFENRMKNNPPTIPADPSNGLQQVTLHLTQANYQHPTQGEGSGGSQATYTLEAVEGRR